MRTNRRSKIIGFILILLIVLALPSILQTAQNVIFADGTSNGLSVNVTNSINGVLGKTKTVTVTMNNENKGDNDWIYNVGLKVELDDGLEFVVGSGIAPSSKKFELINESNPTEGQKQILEWVDITDLAPGEIYSFSFEVEILEEYREKTVTIGEGEDKTDISDIKFGEQLKGKVKVKASDDAQTFDNISTEYKEFNIKVMPFEVIIEGGGKLLKGAGETADSNDDKYTKDITVKIINNSKYKVVIDELKNIIANGLQVTGIKVNDDIPAQGTYTRSFYNEDNGESTLEWSNLEINPEGEYTIAYTVAVFDKYTKKDENEDWKVNTGGYIHDSTSLPITVNYRGCIDKSDTNYPFDIDVGESCEDSGSADIIAKDIIITKTLKSGEFEAGETFIYELKAEVNQYHEIGDIVITDILGDGLEFLKKQYDEEDYKITGPTEGLTVTQAVYNNQPYDGETKIIWTIGGKPFEKLKTYSIEFKAEVLENWKKGNNTNPIVAGDTLVNEGIITGKNKDTEDEIKATNTSTVTKTAPLPKITKEIISVNDQSPVKDSDGRYKANIGDKIKFEVTYDASDVKVKQKDVEIVDIFPQGTVVNTDSIKYFDKDGSDLTVDFDNGIWKNVVIDNEKEYTYRTGTTDILRWKFNYIEPEAELTVQYEVTVENEPENKDGKQTFNLAKMSVKNTRDRVQSKRAQVELTYTEPILEIEKTAIPTENLKGGDEVTFTITVTNTGMGTAYGVKVVDELPMELEYENDSATGATANHINGKITFTIDSVSAGKNDNTATITYKAKVVNPIGALRSFKNTAKIEEYKNRNDGSSDTRTYNTDKPSDSANLQAIKPTITMVVDITSTGNTNDLKVGDWIIYEVKVNIPTGTVAYNGYIEVDIPNSGNAENQEVVFVSKNIEPTTEEEISTTSASTNSYDIKFNTDSSPNSGDHVYYIKTKIIGPTTVSASEVQKGKAIFTWEDKISGGASHNTGQSNEVSVDVKLPELEPSITKNKTEPITKGEEVVFTFKVENKGKNTAYNFIPTVKVPAGFTITELPTDATYDDGDNANGGIITLPEVSILDVGLTKEYTFKATLSELQGAGSSKQFDGYSGEYWTNTKTEEEGTTGAGHKLDTISCNTTVNISSVTIEQKIIKHTNGYEFDEDDPNADVGYIRPSDTVDYKITVTVPEGTIAYDLNIVDTIPSNFEVVKNEDEEYKTIANEGLAATESDITVNNGVATIELGKTVDASTAKQVIVKIIRLKAKTDKTYGATKTEKNQVKAEWKKTSGATEKLTATTDDATINVREPNLTIGNITANGTQFNNTTQEITLTIPVTNDRNTPAYNSEFKLVIPAEFEVADDSHGGTIENNIITWTGVTVPAKNGNDNGKQEFTVKLKLKENSLAGAGKKDIPVEFKIGSYKSKEENGKTYGSVGPESTDLSIAPVTIEKTVKATTLSEESGNGYDSANDYVRPGDTITYEIEITVPNNTTAYGLTFKDILGVEQEIVSIDFPQGFNSPTADENGVYSIGNITGGEYLITVVSKIRTGTASDDKESFSNKANVKWAENNTGIDSLEVEGTIKQPKFDLTINKDDDIEGPDGISTITVKLEKKGDVPAYNIETEIEIPVGLVVDETSPLPTGATLSGNKIIWKIDGSLNVDDTISFKVKAKEGEEANSTHDIQGKVEYTSTADENSKLYTKDNVKCDVKLVGKHELSKANEGQGDGDAKLLEGQVEQTLTFTHVLKNTGAGKDTYGITINDIGYPGTIKYNDKEFKHDGNGNWIGDSPSDIELDVDEEITLTYEITIPIEAPKDEEKTHKIIATSTSGGKKPENQQDKVRVIGIEYGNTVFDGITAPEDGSTWQNNWSISTFGPGQKIKLTALTSHDITSVTAKIRVAGNGGGYVGGTDVTPITLTEISGEKGKWQTDYQLPSDLSKDNYFVEYYSYNENISDIDKLQDEDNDESKDVSRNNYFKIDNPSLVISLVPDETTVKSKDDVTFTLIITNNNTEADAFYVIPKITIPSGVELDFNSFSIVEDGTVTGAVYGKYDNDTRELEFYIDDKPFNIDKGKEVKIEFKVKTNEDLSADEVLNFPATTGPYYTALDGNGEPIAGTEQSKTDTSASLKTESITFDKKIKSTTNNGENYVRPGDQIVYQIDIGIPDGLKINELNLKDIVYDPNDTLIIEKVVIGSEEYTVNNGTWDSDDFLEGATKDIEVLVYARVKDEINTNIFTTKSTANLTWKVRYGDGTEKTAKAEKEIVGKRPHIIIDSFTSKDNKESLESPDEVIEFTGKIKNNGESTAYKTKVVATLPDGMIPVDGTYGNGKYNEDDNTIAWTVDEIYAKNSKEITFSAKADIDKPLPANAEVKFELVEYRSTDHDIYFTEYKPNVPEKIAINADRKHTITGPFSEEEYAGNTVEFKHTITNAGGSRETFDIEVIGYSEFDIDYGPKSVELAPGESKEITITVIIPKTMRKGNTKYDITLTTKGGNETVSTTTVDKIKVIGEDIDGWVSNALWSKWEKDKYRDEWKETTYYINQPIKISAITAIDIDKVEIEIYKADEETKIGNTITLNNYEGDIKAEKGNNTFKLWDNIYDKDDLKDSLLGLGEGRYFVKYKAYKGDNVIEEEDSTKTSEVTDLGYNNYFTVKSNIKLKGTITLKDPQDGDTVDGAEVRLVDLTDKPVLNPKTGEEYKTTVGPDGKYEFENVPINQYTLEVVPKTEKYKKYSKAIDVKPEPGKDEVVIDVELVGFTIDLKANPSTIVGDGDSRTILTTKVLCKDGLPVEGAEVKFKDLLAGNILGEAKDPKNPDGGYTAPPSSGKYTTNEKGEVYIVYESEKIEGIISQVIPVTAVVECKEKGIYGEDSIFITFEPASIKGVVKDNNTGEPIEGARVIVTSQDGSFSAEQITGPNGDYKIAIPKEGDYDIEIIKPVKIGDEIHNVSFKQKANVEVVTGVEADPIPADKTFTGLLKMADKDGKENIVKTVKDDKDIEKEIKIKDITGKVAESKVDKDTGVFSIEGLTKDTEYEFLVTTEVNGAELLLGKIKVKITDDGEINIHEELIDPYGTITDAKTGNVLGGVHVELYYADTARNTTNGKTVNKPVPQIDLGGIFTFPPNDNKNPQWSTATTVYNNHPDVQDHGNYAWMVPANADYYIIATKSGYVTYDSRKDSNLVNTEKGSYFIKVDTDVVKYDFAMTPISSSSGSSSGGGGKGGGPSVPTVPKKPEEPVESDVPVEPDLPESGGVAKDTAIESSSDKRAYLEEKEAKISIKYYIKEEPGKDMEIVFYIPEGAVVKDTDGGTIVGDKIVWKVDDSEIGKIAEKKLRIILPKITKMEETIETISELRVDGEIIDTSVLEIVIFSNRYGNGEHPRYIQGIPGGTFNPAANITRAEIAVIFSRILKLESLVKHEKMYDDVDIDAWHAKGIEAATKKGLFQGIGNNMFKPNQPITRGELAAVIARYLNLPDKKPIQLPFKDIESNWAFTYITELYRNNIITGYQDGSFKPGSQLRRDEAVTMINRMLNRGPLKNVEPTYPDMPKDNWAFGDVEECSRTHRYYRNEDSSETHVETIDEDLFF
ncbi:MAG: S-layer homology domain-containing protein [Firmicutes bacterium]|nr:S-layer homology domain-containing protein [Bacillota bacterium]